MAQEGRNFWRITGITAAIIGCAVIAFVVTGCLHKAPAPGTVQDEALRAGRSASSFPAADEDYFHDMDGAIAYLRFADRETSRRSRIIERLAPLAANARAAARPKAEVS